MVSWWDRSHYASNTHDIVSLVDTSVDHIADTISFVYPSQFGNFYRRDQCLWGHNKYFQAYTHGRSGNGLYDNAFRSILSLYGCFRFDLRLQGAQDSRKHALYRDDQLSVLLVWAHTSTRKKNDVLPQLVFHSKSTRSYSSAMHQSISNTNQFSVLSSGSVVSDLAVFLP
mgnify:CR=1 FL=1